MRNTILLLVVMLGMTAGSAWLAQQWRVEASKYVTDREKEGDILRESLVSEGVKEAESTEAEYHRRGTEEASTIDAGTESSGRIMVAEAGVTKTNAENADKIAYQAYLITPLQGSLYAENKFLSGYNNSALLQEERDADYTTNILLKKAREDTFKEYQAIMAAIRKAMEPPQCPDRPPRN